MPSTRIKLSASTSAPSMASRPPGWSITICAVPQPSRRMTKAMPPSRRTACSQPCSSTRSPAWAANSVVRIRSLFIARLSSAQAQGLAGCARPGRDFMLCARCRYRCRNCRCWDRCHYRPCDCLLSAIGPIAIWRDVPARRTPLRAGEAILRRSVVDDLSRRTAKNKKPPSILWTRA